MLNRRRTASEAIRGIISRAQFRPQEGLRSFHRRLTVDESLGVQEYHADLRYKTSLQTRRTWRQSILKSKQNWINMGLNICKLCSLFNVAIHPTADNHHSKLSRLDLFGLTEASSEANDLADG